MASQIQLILNADVYSPAPLGVRNLLVAGNKIISITELAPNLDPTLNVSVTDLKGKRLLPGFIDGHAHITGGGGETGPESRVPPVFLSQFTSAGVTTVVGLLGTDDLTRNTETLVTQARGLSKQGLSAYCYCGGYHVPPVTVTGSVRGDIVFIDPVIGVGEIAISDHRSSQPTLDELLRVASEAHVAGLMSGKAGVLHLHLGDGKRGLQLVREALEKSEIPARVFNPTHVNRQRWLFDEACELAQQGCYIDVTAFPADEHSWTAAQAIKLYLERELPADKLTVSSDGGGCLPTFDQRGELVTMDFGRASALTETLQELLADGLSLEQILPIFSSNVARLLKLEHKGQIAEGMDADLLIIDAQHNITDVMAMGRWHINDGTQTIVDLFEEQQ
ncbi:MAG: beta-aspartyl-peptidase [Pseudomonadales bacterium]